SHYRRGSGYRRAPTGRVWRRGGVSTPKITDPLALLDALNAAKVEYIVVGGAAVILHGAPVTTQDLDIVHHLTRINVKRLKRTLDHLHARIREPGPRDLVPDETHRLAGGQLRLLTDFGPLDVLGRLHDGRTYEALLPTSELMGDRRRKVRVIDLPTLIEIKGS